MIEQQLDQHPELLGSALAWALKAQYDEFDTQDPARAHLAVQGLAKLAESCPDEETRAIAAWVSGLALIDSGEMEQALTRLDAAAASFLQIGDRAHAAATQVSKLHALAILGRYDEALATGSATHATFLELGDLLAAAKIEQNLGNLYFRREQYREAITFYTRARERALDLGATRLLIQVNNGLANVLAQQHRFSEAIELYTEALDHAERAGFELLLAATECNLGCLELFQGHYAQALSYLERSRHRYAAQGMPHESALAEHELADAYLELNLLNEAAQLYERILPIYARLGMRAEEARALSSFGQVQLLRGALDSAYTLLARAQQLFEQEENPGGIAVVALHQASLALISHDYTTALIAARAAEVTFAHLGIRGRLLLASYMVAEALVGLGEHHEARAIFKRILDTITLPELPQLAYRCHSALGQLAFVNGARAEAFHHFGRAIAIIEDLRAPLPAEEFRLGFMSDKLIPYTRMAQLYLEDPHTPDVIAALGLIERARSRALVDLVHMSDLRVARPRDTAEAELFAQLEAARADLNWIYNQIYRPGLHDHAHSAQGLAALQNAAHQRELEVLELTRRLRQRSYSSALPQLATERLDNLADIQRDLGTETVLIAYASLDTELLAFVVDNSNVVAVRHLANEPDVTKLIEQLRFQIEALKAGSGVLADYMHQLTSNTRHWLGKLYDVLMRPLEASIAGKRIIVVPHRSLYYVPFHALYDGQHYLIERQEVIIVPSISLLRAQLRDHAGPIRRALLLGVPDQQIPLVVEEIHTIAPLFPEATVLMGDAATRAALSQHAPEQDVVHLACHGQFRQDNPFFSSLGLADGWLTVQEAYELNLSFRLVTLSACESGAGSLMPGDELIGMVRGFVAAGARALLVGLWMVDDEAAAKLMYYFYSRLMAGDGLAAALRAAQCQLLNERPHPFYWAAFALIGGW
ncbi:MAG: CHAT domain-containing protein [Chloroflexaceae bacterium]|nr:CHAT domain-containing protein [Chloroflexaceae bacterium]